ncbi:MAG: response regulator [Reyranellaceae bacterium]
MKGLYVMHFAQSGEEALEKLQEGVQPELIVILSDINMPGIDGLSRLQKVKERTPDLPVIMVTAYGDGDRRRQAQEYGAAEFLTKPVDFPHLERQLADFTSRAT